MNYLLYIIELTRRKRGIRKLLMKKINNYPLFDSLRLDYIRLCDLIDRVSIQRNDEYTIDFLDEKEVLPKDVYDDYYEVNEFFRKMFFDINDNAELFEAGDVYFDHKKINISDKELLEIGRDFYSKLPTKNPKYLELYKYYTNPKNNLLYFKHYKEEYQGTMALTYPVYFPQYKPYFLINRENTIIDLMSLCHEIAHGISFRPNQKDGTNKRIKELHELEGQWFNFLVLEYAKKELNFSEGDKLELNNFMTNYDDFIGFIVTSLSVDLYNEKGNVTLEELDKKLEDIGITLPLCDELFDDAFSISPLERTRYFASSIISTDLEKLYQTDPEKAFWDYERIQKFKDYDDLKKLSKYDVTCFEDGYKNFNDKVKRLTLIQKNMEN